MKINSTFLLSIHVAISSTLVPWLWIHRFSGAQQISNPLKLNGIWTLTPLNTYEESRPDRWMENCFALFCHLTCVSDTKYKPFLKKTYPRYWESILVKYHDMFAQTESSDCSGWHPEVSSPTLSSRQVQLQEKIRLLMALSNWLETEGQNITSLGNLFHCLIVFTVTKFFLTSSPNILFQFTTVVSHHALLWTAFLINFPVGIGKLLLGHL